MGEKVGAVDEPPPWRVGASVPHTPVPLVWRSLCV